jgi:hypothetical protein
MTRIIRKRRAVVALALGFTAIPGVALAATDAVPRDPFKLGQDNRIAAATTTLSGADQGLDGVLHVRKAGGGIGAALKVENTSAGVAEPGIAVRVQPGQSPIQVNSEAGKVNFLNVDKLGGRSAEDFLPTRFYGNATSPVQGTGSGKTLLLTAIQGLGCDDNDIALNAGGNAVDADDDLNGTTPFRSSYPIEFQDNGAPSKFSANIICMDSAAPFRSSYIARESANRFSSDRSSGRSPLARIA